MGGSALVHPIRPPAAIAIGCATARLISGSTPTWVQAEAAVRKLAGGAVTIKRKTGDAQALDVPVSKADIAEAVARQLRVAMDPELLDIGADKLVGERAGAAAASEAGSSAAAAPAGPRAGCWRGARLLASRGAAAAPLAVGVPPPSPLPGAGHVPRAKRRPALAPCHCQTVAGE